MSQRSSAWSITINNPTQTDEYDISQARLKGWKVEGQLEKGDSGTPHYQLLVKTPQVRFSLVKKAFPRAHIEPCRNLSALTAYVQKEASRVGSLQISQDKYPSQLQLFQWFAFYYRDIKKEWPDEPNLKIFDLMCAQKIAQGYYIGPEIMNPQIRAFYRKFGDSIARRELASLDRQTDRQPRLISQEINIPQYDSSSSTPLQEETSNPPSSDDDA